LSRRFSVLFAVFVATVPFEFAVLTQFIFSDPTTWNRNVPNIAKSSRKIRGNSSSEKFDWLESRHRDDDNSFFGAVLLIGVGGVFAILENCFPRSADLLEVADVDVQDFRVVTRNNLKIDSQFCKCLFCGEAEERWRIEWMFESPPHSLLQATPGS